MGSDKLTEDTKAHNESFQLFHYVQYVADKNVKTKKVLRWWKHKSLERYF